MRPSSAEAAKLVRLHLLNNLFGFATGCDLYLAQQIESAIELWSRQENSHESDAFVSACAKLWRQLAPGSAGGFLHCDAAGEEIAGPLWARQAVLRGLKHLAACGQATLLVTGFERAVRPSQKRWTPRLRREYQETLELLRQLAARRASPRSDLTLLLV